MQLNKKQPVLKQETEVLKFYQKKNEYKKQIILLSVLVTKISTW